jgi:tetratricopeptide (TPR) repeat protein
LAGALDGCSAERHGAAVLPAALAAGFDAPLPALPADPSALPAVQVLDLHYGDVLFDFYRDDTFNALIKLNAYRAQGHLKAQAEDAELLLGGLYLSLGQHLEAGRIFQQVLDQPRVPQSVRDRARFYLAKVWYQRGYHERAEAVFAAMGSSLSPEMDAERRALWAQALLHQGKLEPAIALLSTWSAPSQWRGYAEFNLGVALVRAQRLAEGVAQLEAAGTLAGAGQETAALRDKANLALGYALLQAGQPARAQLALERVRLEGPLSTKALLGEGWALAALGQHEQALVPWLELQGRSLLDAAVQESYLAVPFAYSKLGADAQAVEQYEAALQAFTAERARLDESIAALRKGQLLHTIVDHEGPDLEGWLWQLRKLPEVPESRYLVHLLASHEFQEALKNYRSLLVMERNLAAWQTSLGAFDDLVAQRQQRFAEWLPAALSKLDAVDVDGLRRSHMVLRAALSRAEAEHEGAALATPREHAVWEKLERMDATFIARPNDPDLLEARDKYQLLKGVMAWRLSSSMKERAARISRDLTKTQRALGETTSAWAHVAEAREQLPARFADYRRRLDALQPRVTAALQQLLAMKTQQEQFLATLAVTELQAEQGRLAAYEVQARFALAAIYDRATQRQQP